MTRPRTHIGPIPGLRLGYALPIVLVVLTVSFVVCWRFLPLGINASITAFVLLVGVAVVVTLSSRLSSEIGWTHSEFADVRAHPAFAPTGRARDLAEFEAAVAGSTRFEGEFYLKLRPHLRYIAEVRLRVPGIDLDHDQRAKDLVGPLYDVIREGARETVLFAPGPTVESLAELVDRLERI